MPSTSDSSEISASGARRPRMMTAKAERRQRERDGTAASRDETEMSPAAWRALQAEKRAAWRQARLKSLEQVTDGLRDGLMMVVD